jgi:uncharacterized protein with HEPN domain
MSDRVWWFRLRDILDAIDFVSNHLEGVTYEEFEADEVLQRAILHTLEMAGEATTGIPRGFTCQHPEIPWRGMNEFRNVIVHQYFRINLELVWNVTHRDLLPLRDRIAELLESLEDHP